MSRAVSYADIRNNSGEDNKNRANVFPVLSKEIQEYAPRRSHIRDCISCNNGSWQHNIEICTMVIVYYGSFAAVPVFIGCKILQALFPYFILGHLLYHNELVNTDLFQLIMLFTYIGLQMVLFMLGIKVLRVIFWLWHIHPGKLWLKLRQTNSDDVMEPIHNWYKRKTWEPMIRSYLSEMYGDDISNVIMDYCNSIIVVEGIAIL